MSTDDDDQEPANNNEPEPDDDAPLRNGCVDTWYWNRRFRSPEVLVAGPKQRTVFFHPNWSKGTAGIRGNRVLNNGRFYWEINVSHRVFGTSMMFGIGSEDTRLHVNEFVNMLGEDENSWGLSHKGLLWHGGVGLTYTKRFQENKETKIGILYDGIDGTLTYYKDGQCLGVAFRGINQTQKLLYPIVCSTAAKTEMVLTSCRRDFASLQDRCRAEIIKHIKHRNDLLRLKLPPYITRYLTDSLQHMEPLTSVDNFDIFVLNQGLIRSPGNTRVKKPHKKDTKLIK